ncbi:hypothetical protein BDN72DRAFT_841535 [Pluteus cervinus]|uniref:Uncharacterized protein n=1 Tax=Pluteus cervinus TaxID=181527 RepID=A0ACD3ASM7_9AGAR|nr:hypothetical protein BDN72DRAFT_841535 [Pluteus cervinus]
MSTSILITTPSSIDTDTNQRGLALIDGKILALKEQIRELSQDRNELVPVGRLFPDVLVEIFSYLKREWGTGPNGKVPFTLNLTHVSHRWRAAALNCAALWNEIFFQDEKLVAEWLKRSHSSKLCVSVEARLEDKGAIQDMLGQLHRIRYLQVKILSPSISLPQLLDIPAPVLSFMSIECVPSDHIPSLEFLSRSFPGLVTLSLRYCGKIDLASAIFTNVTSLIITDCSIEMSLSAILVSFQRMPGLRVVKLGTVTLSDNPVPESLPLVKLPATWKFEYRGTQGDLDFQLLSQLRFVKRSSLRLQFVTKFPGINDTGDSPSFTAALATIQRIWRWRPQIRELRIQSDNDGLILLTPRTTFGIQCPFASVVDGQHIPWMLANISLFAEVKDLYITGTIRQELWPVVEQLEKLHSIKIKSAQSGQLFDLFVKDWKRIVTAKEGAAGRGNNLLPRLIFPELRSIHLELANFRNVSDFAITALQHRRDHGKEIPALSLDECSGLGDFWIRGLSGAVGTVDWDGVDPDEEDSDESDGSVAQCEECYEVLLCKYCDASQPSRD